MPANEWEIDEALEEGVNLEILAQPVEVISDHGRVSALRCVRMELGEPDESGRRRPIPIEGSEFEIACDAVVAAIAQAPEISFLDEDHGLEISKWNSFVVNEGTLQTNKPGIFSGGDAVTGPKTVVEAMAAGRKAAASIDNYCRSL